MGQTAETVAERKRYDFIDILRVVACFLVIVNHTASFVFLGAEPERGWFICVTWHFISKVSVPVFVMITGYTLLDRQESYKKCGVRILRAATALGVFSAGYYLYQWSIGDRVTISVVDFFLALMESPLSLAHWYMYMYIGLLIMMPFLQKLVANLSKRDCEVFIALSLLINGTWPIIEHWFKGYSFTNLVDFALFDSYIGILLIGYYMKKYVAPSKKLLLGAVLCFVVCIVFNVLMTYQEYLLTSGVDYLFYDDRVLLPIVLQSASFFYIAQYIRLKGLALKIVQIMAGCTFGIYLISDYVIRVTIPILGVLREKGVHAIIAIVLYEIIVFGIGFVAVFIMKKIPLLKKIL